MVNVLNFEWFSLPVLIVCYQGWNSQNASQKTDITWPDLESNWHSNLCMKYFMKKSWNKTRWLESMWKLPSIKIVNKEEKSWGDFDIHKEILLSDNNDLHNVNLELIWADLMWEQPILLHDNNKDKDQSAHHTVWWTPLLLGFWKAI